MQRIFLFCLSTLVAPVVTSHSAPLPEKSQLTVDARAVAAFDRAIKGLKKFHSFSFGSDETRLDLPKPQTRFASGSMQWPYRLKLLISREKREFQAVIGRDRVLFWNGGEVLTMPLQTQAARQQQFTRIIGQAPTVSMGPALLRAGENPLKASSVSNVTYARIAGGKISPVMAENAAWYERVSFDLQSKRDVTPAHLVYFFNAASGWLERLEIAGDIGGEAQRWRGDFDSIYFNENFLVDQDGTDRYVYDWPGVPASASTTPVAK